VSAYPAPPSPLAAGVLDRLERGALGSGAPLAGIARQDGFAEGGPAFGERAPEGGVAGRQGDPPATGYLGPNGVVRGRPPLRGAAKRQVTLRLDPDVLDRFRAVGPGLQGRINEAVRKAVGL
jgi:hypothetical protein